MYTSIQDYAGAQRSGDTYGGQSTTEELGTLAKALEARSITGRETTDRLDASGAPLKAESLEKNLKVLTFREQHIKLFRSMPSSPAFNTVEQFVQLVSYGNNSSGFVAEGALPATEDSVYRQKAEFVKLIGVTKEVTHLMQLVNTVVSPIVQKEIQNAILWILRKANRAVVYGNANNIPLEFNGLYAQHEAGTDFSSYGNYMDSSLVIDLRGKHATQEAFNDAAMIIAGTDSYGFATDIYGSNEFINNFTKEFFTKQRIMLGKQSSEFVAGGKVKSISTSIDEVNLNSDVFLGKEPSRKVGLGATHVLAAGTPTKGTGVSGGAIGVVTDTSNKFKLPSFQAANGAGDYYYAVSAVNQYGESELLLLNTNNTTPLAVATTQSVDISIVDGGGTNPATAYKIYRTKAGAVGAADLLFYPLFTVSKAQVAAGFDGAGAAVIRDRNRFLPDTDQAFMAQYDEETLAWKQLAPIMKMDLARVSLAYRFATVLYGTPQLYAPKRMVRFINAGAYVAS